MACINTDVVFHKPALICNGIFGARLLEPMASSFARCGLSGIAHFNVCSFWQRMLKCLFSAGKEIFHAIVFNMLQQELIPHLFRTEFRKIAAVLCKTFGMEHIETAEDIAGAAFLAALETWSYKGIPENPVAWLYTVAKEQSEESPQP